MKRRFLLLTVIMGFITCSTFGNIANLFRENVNFAFLMISLKCHMYEHAFVLWEVLRTNTNNNNTEMDRNTEQKQVCDFKEIFHLFSHHKSYYPEINIFSGENYENIKIDYSCEELKRSIIEREHRRWNEFRISPSEEKQGISEPIIILFGKYIKPPYFIEKDVKNNKIFLNGVQIAPHLYSPSLEFDEEGIFWMKAYNFDRQIHDNERKYKILIKDYIQKQIDISLKSRNKEWALKKLESTLKAYMQIGCFINYWIYDKDNLLFDILMPYSRTYDEVPEKYLYILNHPLYQWPYLRDPEPRTKYFIENINTYYESLKGEINDNRVHIVTFNEGIKSYSIESLSKFLDILNLPINEYEKVKMMDGIIDNDIAIELVFNLSGENLIYLTQRFNNDKQ